ncbi:ABC transporter substrate-binding protein [uncultured Parolsenella sp.]|uniref:ABC transporter substrate-binding protein n=1 Tax=uncultured Parolsenella sp. TaxID=2083008 RepID=UPI0025F8B610|nr:ABC transporter substrate-binding protein [uncultured Parolsenella sp.]
MTQPTMNRRTFVKGGLAASAMAALAACGKKGGDTSAASGSAAESGTLSYYINNPSAIDPYDLEEDQGMMVGYQLFDALTTYDFTKNELVGLAAESWDVNDAADEFTFHLVKGAKFHDGTTVTSKSFKQGWERILNPNTSTEHASAIGYHLAMVDGYSELSAGEADELKGVTCPDDDTLVVKLSQPYADFPYVCMHPALSPVPDCALEDFDTFFFAPVGNGPFKMDGKWEDGQQINLVRFDDYSYGEKAKLDGVHFNIQKDVQTAYTEFQAGNLDVAQVPTTQLKDAISQYGESEDGYTATTGKEVLTGDELSIYYLMLNVNDEQLKDKDLRHALSLAINRQAICDTVFEGTREPAGGIVSPGIKGYVENEWADSRYDVDAAKKILDEKYPADANGKRNLSIALTYNLDGDHKAVMEMVMADWSALGIETSSNTAEWASILSNTYPNADFQVGRLGWIADYPIMDNFLYPLFVTGGDNNYGQYSNADVDKGLLDARAIASDDERVAKYQEVDKLIAEDMPVIPLFYYKHQMVCSQRVKSLYMDPQKLCDMSTVELSA